MKHISSEKLAGILITVSIHLAVIIVLLLTVVTPHLKSERVSMEFDFSEREKAEKLAEQLAKSKALNEKLDCLDDYYENQCHRLLIERFT